MKSYTDIEQSKKLAEILPIETSDFHFLANQSPQGYLEKPIWGNSEYADYSAFPCWSLAALLHYLKSRNKFPEIKELSDGHFKLTTFIWDGKNSIQFSIADNLVDACYEMIVKLNEEKLL